MSQSISTTFKTINSTTFILIFLSRLCFGLSNNWRACTPPQPCNICCTWIGPCLWKYQGELKQCKWLHCCSEEDSRKGSKSPSYIPRSDWALHLPQFTVITRWGTWIRCTVFLCKAFDKIKCLRLNRCSSHQAGPAISQQQRPRVYKYLPDVIQSLVEDMKRNEEWKRLKSVRDSLDGFPKDSFELNLKKNPGVETFATLTELPLRMLTRYVPLVSIDVEQFLSV